MKGTADDGKIWENAKYLHVAYDWIDNGAGELMLVMDAPDDMADDDNAKLIYDGNAEGVLVRNDRQIIHLPIIAEGVREMLKKLELLLVTEMDGEDIDDVYEAEIVITNSSLPIPKKVYENLHVDNSRKR